MTWACLSGMEVLAYSRYRLKGGAFQGIAGVVGKGVNQNCLGGEVGKGVKENS